MKTLWAIKWKNGNYFVYKNKKDKIVSEFKACSNFDKFASLIKVRIEEVR